MTQAKNEDGNGTTSIYGRLSQMKAKIGGRKLTMEIKMNDQVQTPNGPGKIISIPVGKSKYYTVLHETNQAAVYHVSAIQKIQQVKQ